jgi:peptidoglycan/LPS O-acetylase OafA/YrhL
MNVPRRADERARIDVLTGFRGIAAYAVLLAHAVDISFNYLPPAVVHFAASRLAYLGMSLFFVLSGFVIYYNYADTFRTFTFAFST